jgi:hypothetical protein
MQDANADNKVGHRCYAAQQARIYLWFS